MIAEKQIDWPQVAYESIRHLVERRFRIGAYPTYVLLGPDLRIISTDSSRLRGDNLSATLKSVLP